MESSQLEMGNNVNTQTILHTSGKSEKHIFSQLNRHWNMKNPY